MREILIILRREFRERVLTRSFLIGTIGFPLLFGGMMALPALLETREARSIVVIDEGDGTVGEAIAGRLGRRASGDDDNRYSVEIIAGPAADAEPVVLARVEAGEIDGALIIPADVLATNQLRYRSTSVPSPLLLAQMQAAATEILRSERLRVAGIDVETIAEVIQPVSILTGAADAAGDAQEEMMASLIFAYVLAFVIYFMVFLYGVTVMRSVLEEKTSRIAEVLVSSIRSTHLMAGKILGVAGAAIAQILVWTILMGAVFFLSSTFDTERGIDVETIRGFLPGTGMVALFLVFLLLGFFLYAAAFAGLGAAITSEQEAQSFQMILLLPLVTPLLFLSPLTSDPRGTAATFLGLFPLTSPVAMPMRLTAAPIPAAEVALSIGLLIFGLIGMAWVAGKIYRIGILATGSRPNLRELVRWIRMA